MAHSCLPSLHPMYSDRDEQSLSLLLLSSGLIEVQDCCEVELRTVV